MIGNVGVLLLVNALIGLLLFEVSWYNTRKLRIKNEERDAKYPAFRRLDHDNWVKWKFYPGALTILVPRILIKYSVILLSILFGSTLSYITKRKSGDPYRGWARDVMGTYTALACYIFIMNNGAIVKNETIDFDYSYYLGKDYKNKTPQSHASVIVANHVSWYDNYIIARKYGNYPLTAKFQLKRPIVGSYLDAAGVFFIDNKTQEEREQAVQLIKERCSIAAKGEVYPLLIFPEGLGTNNRGILKFKRGAFSHLGSIQPIVQIFQGTVIDAQTHALALFSIIMLQFCLPISFFITMKVLPVFEPNDYLFKTHADKGKEKWEIVAWAVRDAMAKAGNLQLYNDGTEQLYEFNQHIFGYKHAQDKFN